MENTKDRQNKAEKKWEEKRSVPRDQVFNTLGHIKVGLDSESGIEELTGIVQNVSSRGCCILVKTEFLPDIFQFCRISIGQQMLIPSQVRWIKSSGNHIYEIGFCYQV